MHRIQRRPSMIVVLSLVALALLVPPRSAGAQQSAKSLPVAPAAFDPASATEYADSFVTLVRGQPGGWHLYALRRTPAGYDYSESWVISQLMDRRVSVAFDRSLAVLRAADSNHMLGVAAGSDLAYEGQRARGTVRTRGPGGVRTRDIDTVFAAGTFNGLALLALLPTIDWQPTGVYALSVFDTDEQSVAAQTLRVLTEEQVTVPAGTFDTYRAELSTAPAPVLLWYTRSVPHRLVKLATTDGSIVDVLAHHSP